MPQKETGKAAGTSHMAATRTYLDYNASAPLLPAARGAMLDAFDLSANPSSVHAEGRRARRIVEDARAKVAALCGAEPSGVVFTSGASEAAAMLLAPDWRMGRAPLRASRLFVAASDHPCILQGGRFPRDAIGEIGVDADGRIDMEALRRALAAHDRSDGLALVATHAVNNETGVVQDVAGICALARQFGALTVIDAAQAPGRIALDMAALGADFLILSAHKMGGPKGAGAVVAAGSLMMPEPLVRGGGQERGHRAGTENVAAIAGFGAASVEALTALSRTGETAALRDRIEEIVLARAPQATIYGVAAKRVGNTSFFSLPGIKAETAQIAFDLAGVSLSAGSACSSGKVGPSHVLRAMGFGTDAGALRVSLGPDSTDADVERFAEALSGLIGRHEAATKAA